MQSPNWQRSRLFAVQRPAASAQTAFVKRVSKPKTHAILGFMRLNFPPATRMATNGPDAAASVLENHWRVQPNKKQRAWARGEMGESASKACTNGTAASAFTHRVVAGRSREQGASRCAVEGHTDTKVRADCNLLLSHQRAEAVRVGRQPRLTAV
jgi:hypothetical protein